MASQPLLNIENYINQYRQAQSLIIKTLDNITENLQGKLLDDKVLKSLNKLIEGELIDGYVIVETYNGYVKYTDNENYKEPFIFQPYFGDEEFIIKKINISLRPMFYRTNWNELFLELSVEIK